MVVIGFIANVEFVWGFQSKIVGYSKTSPSFYYPPPTTILGALAESIARENHLGERKGKEIIPKLASNLLALGIKPINCIPVKFADINRIIASRITGGIKYPNPKYPYESFDAPATGKTLLTPLNQKPPQISIYMVFKNEEVTLDKEEIQLNKDHFWSIHRLGTKESRVAVLDVQEFQPDKIEEGWAITSYSFPLLNGVKIIGDQEPKWVSEDLINPFDINAYNESDNPVINYIMGRKIIRYKLPVMVTIEKQPFYKIAVEKGRCCIYVKEEEKVVGLCQK